MAIFLTQVVVKSQIHKIFKFQNLTDILRTRGLIGLSNSTKICLFWALFVQRLEKKVAPGRKLKDCCMKVPAFLLKTTWGNDISHFICFRCTPSKAFYHREDDKNTSKPKISVIVNVYARHSEK